MLQVIKSQILKVKAYIFESLLHDNIDIHAYETILSFWTHGWHKPFVNNSNSTKNMSSTWSNLSQEVLIFFNKIMIWTQLLEAIQKKIRSNPWGSMYIIKPPPTKLLDNHLVLQQKTITLFNFILGFPSSIIIFLSSGHIHDLDMELDTNCMLVANSSYLTYNFQIQRYRTYRHTCIYIHTNMMIYAP